MLHDVTAFFENTRDLRPHHQPGLDQKRFAQDDVEKNENLLPQDGKKVLEHVHHEFVLELHETLVLEGVILLEFIQFAAVFIDFPMGESFENARTASMIGDGRRQVPGLPAEEKKPPGNIDVLLVHEKILIQVFTAVLIGYSDVIKRFATVKRARPRNTENLFCNVELAFVFESLSVVDDAAIAVAKEAGRVDEIGFLMVLEIVLVEFTLNRRDGRVFVHFGDAFFDVIRFKKNVRVEEHDELALGHFDPLVGALRVTKILVVADRDHVVMVFDDVFTGTVSGKVVDQNNLQRLVGLMVEAVDAAVEKMLGVVVDDDDADERVFHEFLKFLSAQTRVYPTIFQGSCYSCCAFVNMYMRILVTGGAGFIGSHLCERLLQEGHQVIAVDNFITGNPRNLASFKDHPNFTLVEHDITSPLPAEVVGKTNMAPGYGDSDTLKFDEVYHLACPASPVDYQDIPLQTLMVNSIGTKNIIEVAVRHCAAMLLASSSEVYGDPEQHPQKETYWGHVNPIGDRSCYSEGKRFSEALAVNYYQHFGFPLKIVRIFNTYGPRMRKHDGRVIPSFIQSALHDEPLRMHGDGLQTRSFCYIDDMVDGMLLSMGHKEYLGPVNLGREEEISIKELAEKIITLTGSSSMISSGNPLKEDPKRRKPDLTLAETKLGYKPKIDLEDGLKKTIDFFRS